MKPSKWEIRITATAPFTQWGAEFAKGETKGWIIATGKDERDAVLAKANRLIAQTGIPATASYARLEPTS